MSRGAPVATATVEVYLSSGRERGSSPLATVAAAADGSFRLELPAGRYWLMVKDLSNTLGPRRLAEYPGNPVQLGAGQALRLADIELRPVGDSQEAGAAVGTGVRGRILFGAAPAGEVAVMIYEAAAIRLTGPGYVAQVRTDSDGRFQVDLPPGAYRLAARRRHSGSPMGYLQQGDLSATAPRDPLQVPAEGYLDLGDLALHVVDRARLDAASAQGFQQASTTAIEGRVIGHDGKPRAGQFVFVYQDEGMIGRPKAMAQSAADGSFSLSLPGAGTYYIGARSRNGGPRQPGEWAGKLVGTPDSGLEVPAGRRVKGLTIAMEQVW